MAWQQKICVICTISLPYMFLFWLAAHQFTILNQFGSRSQLWSKPCTGKKTVVNINVLHLYTNFHIICFFFFFSENHHFLSLEVKHSLKPDISNQKLISNPPTLNRLTISSPWWLFPHLQRCGWIELPSSLELLSKDFGGPFDLQQKTKQKERNEYPPEV